RVVPRLAVVVAARARVEVAGDVGPIGACVRALKHLVAGVVHHVHGVAVDLRGSDVHWVRGGAAVERSSKGRPCLAAITRSVQQTTRSRSVDITCLTCWALDAGAEIAPRSRGAN